MTCYWKVDRTLLNQRFAADVETLLENDAAEWYVTQGFRTSEAQNALYQAHLKGGPLAVAPGHSAHEKGLAVDVTLVRAGKDIWDYTDPTWRRLITQVNLHPRLHSLDSIGDTDHIEAVNWRAIAAQAQA